MAALYTKALNIYLTRRFLIGVPKGRAMAKLYRVFFEGKWHETDDLSFAKNAEYHDRLKCTCYDCKNGGGPSGSGLAYQCNREN
jgi:hypothetical protein